MGGKDAGECATDMAMRVGLGSDLHRLKAGDGIRLGGVAIPCSFACDAVSDGDVLLHALVDALLGALGLGDIGEHFPESVVRRGEDSRRFVREVMAMLEARKVRVVNADCIIDLERPKLSGWKKDMRESVALLLNIDPSRVNVKAKTGEGLGPIGLGQAVAAQAVVLVKCETR